MAFRKEFPKKVQGQINLDFRTEEEKTRAARMEEEAALQSIKADMVRKTEKPKNISPEPTSDLVRNREEDEREKSEEMYGRKPKPWRIR